MASLPSRPLASPRTPAATARQRLLSPRVRGESCRFSSWRCLGRRGSWPLLAALAAGLVPSLARAAPDLSPGAEGSPRWLAAALGLGVGAYLAARQIRRRM